MSEVYDRWVAGEVGDYEALRAVWLDLAEVESELGPLEAQRDELRGRVAQIVARMDKQRAELPGLGVARLLPPSHSVSYDARAVESFLAKLVQNGYMQLADELATMRRATTRAGGLRIEREKGGRG